MKRTGTCIANQRSNKGMSVSRRPPAVIVVDVAENARGQRVFLLAQSFMPAQEIHVLRGPSGERGPWYEARSDGALRTPEWPFQFAEWGA